jgi:glycosyltransferase involved in cell wall biosynthesis
VGRDANSFCREVARVIADQGLRDRLRQEQEENYAELNWEATADKFVDALSRLG